MTKIDLGANVEGEADVRLIGSLSDGRHVDAVRIGSPGGLQAEILAWGATLRSLTIPGAAGPIETLLQLPSLADYEADTRYLNPVIGRCANRIANAAFTIDGERFQVDANEGANALHGGREGWSKRLWRVQAAEARRCVLAYTSPDGEGGFPGEVKALVAFTLVDEATLEIEWSGRCSRPTPLNLTHHLYFNLSGSAAHTILGDRLQIAAPSVTPVGEGLIPTGAIRPVEGTTFDLRQSAPIEVVLAGSDPQLVLGKGVDLNWVLSGDQPAVRFTSPANGVSLAVETDQPAMQVYTGQGLTAPFHPREALVLEPQGFPDAPNQPSFPSVIVREGELYRRKARYRLEQAVPAADAP